MTSDTIKELSEKIDALVENVNTVIAQRDEAKAAIERLEYEINQTIAQLLMSLERAQQFRAIGEHALSEVMLVEMQDFLRTFLSHVTIQHSTEVH